MDDLMRKMMERFGGQKGFEGKDIEKLITEISGANAHSFFEDHIRGNKVADINSYLAMIGLKATITWKEAQDRNHQPSADLRVYAYPSPDEQSYFLGILDPTGIWARAGLHTGDELISVNGNLIKNTRDFYSSVRNAKLNDIIVVEVKRKNELLKREVTVKGYQEPITVINELPYPTAKQRQLLTQWKAGL